MWRSTAVWRSTRAPGKAIGVNPRAVSADFARSSSVRFVVLETRRVDAEADERERARRAAAGAEALWIELLADVIVTRGAVTGYVERVAVSERRGHQVVGLEKRIAGTCRLQSHALEA